MGGAVSQTALTELNRPISQPSLVLSYKSCRPHDRTRRLVVISQRKYRLPVDFGQCRSWVT